MAAPFNRMAPPRYPCRLGGRPSRMRMARMIGTINDVIRSSIMSRPACTRRNA